MVITKSEYYVHMNGSNKIDGVKIMECKQMIFC